MKSGTPPKTAAPARTNPLLDRLEPAQRKVLLAGLLLFFVMAALTTLLLAYYIYEPEITSFFAPPTPTQAFILIKTPTCSGASLQLGTSSWRIQSIQRLADGSFNVSADTPGVAYWIENLENNYVFALSPTPENMNLLSALQAGEEAILTWTNCNSATYILTAPQTGELNIGILNGEPASMLVVYIPGSSSAPGVWVQGELVGETITSPATYEPASSEVNADISLLETSTSADKQTIQVTISIMNYGSTPITLSQSDISLSPESAVPLLLIQSDPTLPQEIKPGESKLFTLVFPRPSIPIAILKIFTVEFDLEDYKYLT